MSQTAPMARLESTARAAARSGAKLAAALIAAGRRTTWPYRRWCAANGLSVGTGVLFADAPRPLPYRRPVQCRHCGDVVERDLLDEPGHSVRTLRGRQFGHPDRREPDEYDTVCPECGALGPYQPAVVCAACDEYPCICGEEANG